MPGRRAGMTEQHMATFALIMSLRREGATEVNVSREGSVRAVFPGPYLDPLEQMRRDTERQRKEPSARDLELYSAPRRLRRPKRDG